MKYLGSTVQLCNVWMVSSEDPELRHNVDSNGTLRAIILRRRPHRIIRPDLRGLGQSASTFDLTKDLTLANYLGDLNAILDAVGADDMHYGGESLGGILGAIFAAEHPQWVRTLNLVSIPLYLDRVDSRRQCAKHS